MGAEVIIEVLKNKYINPLLDAPKKRNTTLKEPVTGEVVRVINAAIKYSVKGYLINICPNK